MIPLLFAFIIGALVGIAIGMHLNSAKINAVIKEAKEQIAISQKLLNEREINEHHDV